MSNKHIADGEAGFCAVCSTPDCCKIGDTVVPFDSYQSLDKLKVYAKSVSARGKPVLTVGSIIEGTQGNAGSGVISGTSLGSGDCEITSGSPSVSVEGKPVARYGSDVAMNNNNCQGKLITMTGTPDGKMLHGRLPCNIPPLSSPLLQLLKERKAALSGITEALDSARKAIDTSASIAARDKASSDRIDAIRPPGKPEGFLDKVAYNIMDIEDGITRAELHFMRSMFTGLESLGNMGVQFVAKGVTTVLDPSTPLDMAIFAENLRLGNVCREEMDEDQKGLLDTIKEAARKLWDETAEKWEKGTIGDKTEIVTRTALEAGTFLSPAKSGPAGKAVTEFGQLSKTETVVNAATKARGTDGVHIKAISKQTGGRIYEEMTVADYLRLEKELTTFYDAVRLTGSIDVARIAKNTGWPQYRIERVRQHIFVDNTHNLSEGIGRFSPDPYIRDAWQRLQTNNFRKTDIDLLKHEYFESKFEKLFRTDYMTAHEKTISTGRVWKPE